MSSSLRRGALAASALVLSIASLSACAAGNDAQTLEVKPDNAATSVGDVKLQNVNVITQPDQNATGPAVITGQVFNNGDTDQQLRSISLPGTNATVKLTPAQGSGPITVPAHGSVLLGGKGNASAVLPNGREGLKDGAAQPLSFDFSSTGAVRVSAFVFPAKSYFQEWGPSQGASPAAPASPGASAPASAPASPAGQPAKPAANAGASAQGTQQHAGH
ncbi:DUF461 domain-containing protein [Streptomyces sp. NPDC049577]|uniref:DUF461 domain-containing protein n=1 Tax=Streptomyces sp. NPDC049577 TaxID=3155153 RepID=UPI0034199BE7